ncbi:hypothetical protein DPMN_120834 [Dreissena polymorpha]|uniref:Uncharacterized protein n=1 Tax=Dreissena polymorpha TaxID=45954 RepID=A0A9D4GPD5_DREPO|nr:hypothetical protein DPMN_120834 [Dreissena polymorpha]
MCNGNRPQWQSSVDESLDDCKRCNILVQMCKELKRYYLNNEGHVKSANLFITIRRPKCTQDAPTPINHVKLLK